MIELAKPRENVARLLADQIELMRGCRQCPAMHKPVVSCGPVVSKVMLIGQAPGDKEPVLGRPFAWTAGKTLFGWFEHACGISEDHFRRAIYMAAVCRCFPGKKLTGGDRVPSKEEVINCSRWFEGELRILRPRLVIAVGRLALDQFLPEPRLDRVVGRQYQVSHGGVYFDLIPLPHPSGASPWHRVEPGKTLLSKALALVRNHPAIRELAPLREKKPARIKAG